MNLKLLGAPLFGRVSAICSKSQAHRALICAALSSIPSKIECGSVNDDIMATACCLNSMGADIIYCNSAFDVNPIDISQKKAKREAIIMNCRESGSTLRFLLPVVCALGLDARIDMEGRLPSRPMDELIEELKRHGARIEKRGSSLYVSGALRAGNYTIAGNVSSQYISGLLYAMCILGEPCVLKVTGDVQSRSYIDMTLDAMREFGVKIVESNEKNVFSVSGKQRFSGKCLKIEGDWSNAAFWLCAGATSSNGILVDNLNLDSSQGDRRIEALLREFGAEIKRRENALFIKSAALNGIEIDASDIPDLVPVLCAVACAANGRTTIKNAERLRIKESDRLEAIYDMLTALGAAFTPTEDGIIIEGAKPLSRGRIDSRNDHRIAMTAAILSTVLKDEIEILDAQCVNKSYPDFWGDFKSLGGKAEEINI